LLCGTGVHRISRGARILPDNRNGLRFFAAGVVLVTIVVLGGFVFPGRQGARNRVTRSLAVFAQVKDQRGRRVHMVWA
jgi:hypothetical protein